MNYTELQIVPGEKNTAGYLSRHPQEESVSSGHEEKVAKYYVNFICETSKPSVIILKIKSAILTEKTFQRAIEVNKTRTLA